MESWDIPVKGFYRQFEEEICMECGKRKAKYICDYVVGKTFDLWGKGQVKDCLCNKFLCDNCRIKINGRDYCKQHYEELKMEINTTVKNCKKQ